MSAPHQALLAVAAAVVNASCYFTTLIDPNGYITRSINNSRLTFAPTSGGNNSQARTGLALSGKQYCEFVVTTYPAALATGIGICSSPPTALYGSGAFNLGHGNGGCGLPANFYNNNGSLTTDAAYTFVQGDNIGVAYDSATGKLWLRRNGTWLGGGDPAAGTSPTMTISTGGTYYFYVGTYSCSISSGSYVYDIKPNTAVQTYSLPSGFSAYAGF